MHLTYKCVQLKFNICFSNSYTDTELYEEAVRDYEQIYKMAKTRGKLAIMGCHVDLMGLWLENI